MKCPLLSHDIFPVNAPRYYDDRDCIKKECAWWDKTEENCIVPLFVRELEGIRTALFDIAERKSINVKLERQGKE